MTSREPPLRPKGEARRLRSAQPASVSTEDSVANTHMMGLHKECAALREGLGIARANLGKLMVATAR